MFSLCFLQINNIKKKQYKNVVHKTNQKVVELNMFGEMFITYYCRDLKHCINKPEVVRVELLVREKWWFKGVRHRTGGPELVAYYSNGDRHEEWHTRINNLKRVRVIKLVES